MTLQLPQSRRVPDSCGRQVTAEIVWLRRPGRRCAFESVSTWKPARGLGVCRVDPAVCEIGFQGDGVVTSLRSRQSQMRTARAGVLLGPWFGDLSLWVSIVR